MKTFTCLAAIAAATLAVATPAAAQRGPGGPGYGQQDEEARFDAAQQRFDREVQLYRDAVERYRESRRRGDWRGPPGGSAYNDPRDDEFYDPVRDYRAPPPNYRDRVLREDERVYRGQDGRYYCKRSDGTTGLIVGAAAGGLFGNAVASGRSRTLGTILGAIAGGAIGSSVDRNQEVRCR